MAVIFCGIVMVGAADFFGDDGTSGVSSAIVGDIIVICAQVAEFRIYLEIRSIEILN